MFGQSIRQPKLRELKPAVAAFSFHCGSLALDFVGTVGSRASAQPIERLPTAIALSRWLSEAGLLATDEASRISDADVKRAVALREAIALIGIALIEGVKPLRASLMVINAAAEDRALGVPQLNNDMRECWKTEQPLRFALSRVAADAIVVFSAQKGRLTRCALAECGALLLSHSRNEQRRWCSMETCGNRSKVAAFRARLEAVRLGA